MSATPAAIDRGTTDSGVIAMRPTYVYSVTAVRSVVGWGLERVVVHVCSIYSAATVANLSERSRNQFFRERGVAGNDPRDWLVVGINGVSVDLPADNESLVSGRLLGARINTAGEPVFPQ